MWLDIYSRGKHYMLNIGQEVQRLVMCEECNDCILSMSVKWLNEIWPHNVVTSVRIPCCALILSHSVNL